MSTTIRVAALTIGGKTVECPDGAGRKPAALRLLPSGPAVMATCGQKHGAGRLGAGGKQCFFALNGLTAQALATIAAQLKPGKIAVTLPGGVKLEGRILETGTADAKTQAAAAQFAKANGQQSGDQRGRAPSGGGTAKAAFGALTAGFGAVSAVAGAAGQIAGAAGSAVTATAGAAGKVADVGKAGFGTATAGINAASKNSALQHKSEQNREDRIARGEERSHEAIQRGEERADRERREIRRDRAAERREAQAERESQRAHEREARGQADDD
ncbi:hypothetical protein [Streptomyces sp. NPDC054797]